MREVGETSGPRPEVIPSGPFVASRFAVMCERHPQLLT